MKVSRRQTAMHDASLKQPYGGCLSMARVVMINDSSDGESVGCAQMQLIIPTFLIRSASDTYHHQAMRIFTHVTVEPDAGIEAERLSSSASETIHVLQIRILLLI